MSLPPINPGNEPARSVDLPLFWSALRDASDAAIARGEVFVLILHSGDALADAALLSHHDAERATRLRRERDRLNFMLGRAMVHHLVAPRHAHTPCQLSIAPNGKPFLPDAPAFNLSHSGDYVACAIATDGTVGIDVEGLDRVDHVAELFDLVLHPSELAAIHAAPAAAHRMLFRRCWTRKEAILKATGQGLVHHLPAVNVQLADIAPLLTNPMPLRLIDLLEDDASTAVALAISSQIDRIQLCLAHPTASQSDHGTPSMALTLRSSTGSATSFHWSPLALPRV